MIRILIVEDDAELANGLAGALTQSSYMTDIAHDGQAAIAACGNTDYQLVILDLGLPDMNGIDVLQRMRREEQIIGWNVGLHDFRLISFYL